MNGGQEHGRLKSYVGDLVAVGVWDPLDQSVEAESSQVVGHLPGRDVLWAETAELSDQRMEISVGVERHPA